MTNLQNKNEQNFFIFFYTKQNVLGFFCTEQNDGDAIHDANSTAGFLKRHRKAGCLLGTFGMF